MATIQNLTQDVLAKISQEEDAKFKSGKEKLEQETAAREKRIQKDAEDKKASLEDQAARNLDRKKQGYNNQMRNQVLAKKQDLIQDVYTEAVTRLTELPENEFIEFVKGALSQLNSDQATVLQLGSQSEKQLTEQGLAALQSEFPQLQGADQSLRGQGGFILSQEGMDYNFTFDQIIEEQEEALSAEISKRAFN
ncbi:MULTISPECIES: V-type ATP synthase subunit E [Aerococcus]|uniref:Uncharacterized protein n=1 Tax=Aerococcus sanguinicola TaxID=119206 RepID=A0A5N1GHD9_9LACT|nr:MULTISPECIES: V-type ATP synthase subunit E [Aerococcus]KAA9300212.1 hypothetical protein F6I03_08625 [Aerococcus sanguinicola]MDK6369558.1 V-type ATP synthase subunit E [Aerococcus sp. UMB9870]MDK6680046.1 V-type ATP synthase subunit E [Aerococcus sp. UMB8608]MDK6686073.1 V-type ATP synthase subunit E [Aerococcus sp. UMB8623]MDK6939853.1 V-type ATP synthase subunit E [Aerococcus sp. UMB8487]